MQQNITANNWIRATVILCAITYLYIIIRELHLRDVADDQYFLNIFNSQHIFEKVLGRYYTWTGRFPLELLMVSTIGISTFWKIAIPFAVVLLCFSLSRIANKKVGIISFGTALALFATIPSDINSDASWWVTGFYNYLLPVSLAAYTFSVSYVNSNVSFEKIICVIFSLYFSYMEQAGIAYVIAMISLISFRKETRTKFNFFILIFSFINLVICLKAPGNENRLIVEVWNWYPQYQTYGISNKLALGFDKLHQLMTLRYNIPLILFATSLIVLGAYSGKLRTSVKISMFFVMTFISLSITNSLTGFFAESSFFYSTTLNATRWYSAKIFLSYLYLLIVISSMLFILLNALLKNIVCATPIIAMLLGFMSVTMMGMSPTVYASGLRVNFVFEVTCIISSMYVFSICRNAK
ncbi:hypothetical protein [Pantoea endophytica]|uniref:hypothetical protein n=1 Tax=Pantoea endophytica TaxID=92488 RepID=UPI00301800AA